MTSSQLKSNAIVDVIWIANHIGDPGIRLIEIDVSKNAYDKGHIPGAILWNAYIDLRDSAYRPVSSSKLRLLFSRSGITPKTTIVFYGYGATLGFWLMKTYGHKDVRMLEGPRDQWVEAGEKWTTEVSQPKKSSYPLLIENIDILASRQTVETAIGKPGQVILDVRSEPEYKGERFWPSGVTEDTGRFGHVPSAINVPIDILRKENGALKSPDELLHILKNAGVTRNKEVITYCTIGNRGSQAWFALKYLLDYPSVRVYYGSWVEWGKLTNTQIET